MQNEGWRGFCSMMDGQTDRQTNICDFRVTLAAEKEQLVDYLKVTQSGTKLWFIPIETNCSAG